MVFPDQNSFRCRPISDLAWIVLFLLCLTTAAAPAQTLELDSLKQLLAGRKDPLAQADLLYQIGFFSQFHNLDSTFAYAERLERLSRKHSLEKQLGLAYDLYSMAHSEGGSPEDALEYKFRQMEIWESTKDTGNIMLTLREISTLYSSMDRSAQAMDVLLRSIELAEQSGNQDHLAACYNEMGDLYSYQFQYQKARDYFNKAIAIRSQLPDTLKLFYSYGQLGDLFLNMERYDSAVVYAQRALELAERYDRPALACTQYNNLGYAYKQMGDLSAARTYLEKSLQLATSVGNELVEHQIYNNLAEIESREGNPQRSLELAGKVVAFAQENKFLALEGKAVWNVANAHAGAGAFAQAYEAMQRAFEIRDTLVRQENMRKMAELETQYDTEQKEAQLAQQQLIIAQQKNTQKNFLIAAVVALLLLGGSFQFFRYRQRLQRKEAELALEIERLEAEQLRQLDRLKSNFFANISHEFRTPLTLIQGPVEQALKGVAADETPVRTSNLQMIRRNTLRLQNLVDQLLDLSKLESGKMQLQVRRGPLLPFLRAVIFSFESLAERKGIDFAASFPEELEEAWFDPDKWEKILVNLLSNAFKFTPEGGSVRVVAAVAPEGLQLSVTDSGKGIAPGEIDRIFDRFYQVEGSEAGGTGIGLALVRELVAVQGGKISVESEVGVGTSLHLLLPYRREDFSETELLQSEEAPPAAIARAIPAEEPQESPTPVSPPFEEADERPLLLIAEDNPDLRQFISQILQDSYRILTAHNGREGLEQAIERTPDLLISDVMMPEMDGFELCRTLKEDERTSHIPVVLLTAKAGQEHKVAGLETGADDYLTKPFDEKELRVRVRNLIEQRRQLREKFGGELVLRPSAVAVTSVDQRFLEKVKETIEANLGNEQFSVTELAEAVAFSRSQLHRKLKSLTDKSPNELIRNFRLTRAKELLEQGAGNVSEVALEVGYGNLSYFTKSFKEAFGQLPSEL